MGWGAFVFLAAMLAQGAERVDLRDSLSSVKSQGPARGTCSAFASTALAEFVVLRETDRKLDLSESFAYWSGRQLALRDPYLSPLYTGGDGLPGYVAVLAYGEGAMLERNWPYSTALPCRDSRDPNCFTGVPPRGATPIDGLKLSPIFIARERIAEFILHEKKPIVFNVNWYFGAVNASGEFRMPTPAEARECIERKVGCAGHVILLVGYDAARREFVFRNSWGPSWGDRGYGTIPEDYIVEHCEVCPHLARLDKYDPQTREFVIRVSKGISAHLKR